VGGEREATILQCQNGKKDEALQKKRCLPRFSKKNLIPKDLLLQKNWLDFDMHPCVGGLGS